MMRLFYIDLGIGNHKISLKKRKGGKIFIRQIWFQKQALINLSWRVKLNIFAKLPKDMCFLWVYCLAKESSVLSCLTVRLCFPTESRCEAAYAVWNIFLHNIETQKNRGIFCNYSSVHRSALFSDLQSADVSHMKSCV